MNSRDIMGAWALVSGTRYVEGEEPDHPLGPKPTGLILYTPNGSMGAFIQKDKALTWDGPLLTAYAGRWEMKDGVIRHHVEFNSEEGRAGQTLVRYPRFENELLVLQTEKKQGKRGFSWMDFAWIRAE